MTVQSNLDATVVDLKSELDSIGFLNPGAKTDVDQELIDQIQADMDALASSYGAIFSTSDDGGPPDGRRSLPGCLSRPPKRWHIGSSILFCRLIIDSPSHCTLRAVMRVWCFRLTYRFRGGDLCLSG